MKECDAFRRLVSPFLDGELVGEDRSAFAEHVSRCAPCQASLADERRVVELVRQGVPLYEAPAALRSRVERMLAPAPKHRLAKLAACAALLLATLGLFHARRQPAPPQVSELAALAAGTHVRFTRGELPLDVRSDRAGTIRGFFAGRVPFRLELPGVPGAAQQPYELSGARLVAVGHEPAAFVAYRVAERPVSLLVASASAAQPAGGEVVLSGKLRFHTESVHGLRVTTWTDNGLTYALVSDRDVAPARSCVVCHPSPSERGKLEPLLRTRS